MQMFVIFLKKMEHYGLLNKDLDSQVSIERVGLMYVVLWW